MTEPANPEGPRVADATPPTRIGRYEVLRVLGSGGMATVFLGRLRGPNGFSRLVAIKRAHPHLAADPRLLAMLLDEARVTARIRHANVAQTLEVLDEDGCTAVVMEYVEGVPLLTLFNSLAREEKPMPVAVAVSIAWGVLSGLHAAHEATSEGGEPLHIVHRDVSANNVVVGVDGVVRLLDFGVAKARGRLQPSTEQGGVKGTYAYMAPEQVRDHEVDRRADIYAASVLLWQCLAGRRLWQATDPRTIISATLFEKPPSLCSLRPEVDAQLDVLVQRGLEKAPENRFATALEMALALESAVKLMSSASLSEWLRRETPRLIADAAPPVTPVEASPAPDLRTPTPLSPREGTAHASHTPAPAKPGDARKRSALVVGGAVLILGGGTLLAAAALRGPMTPGSNATEPPEADGVSPSVLVSTAVASVDAAPAAASESAPRSVDPTRAPTPKLLARPQTKRAVVDAAVASPGASTERAPAPDDGLPSHRRPGAIPDTRR